MVSDEELDLILGGSYQWIKVPRLKHVATDTEGMLEELSLHHITETSFLIDKVRELAKQLKERKLKTKLTDLAGMEGQEIIESHPQIIKENSSTDGNG